MHRLLFFAATGRTTQKEGLASIRSTTDFDFDVFADLMPIRFLGELLGKAAKLCTRGPNHIAAPRRVKPSNILSTHHASVHDPYPVRFPKPVLHLLNDLLNRGDIGGVAGENLIAQRHTLPAYHQRYIDLHAIGPMVATVAALGNGGNCEPLC